MKCDKCGEMLGGGWGEAPFCTNTACSKCPRPKEDLVSQSGISRYWKGLGKTLADRKPGRTFQSSYGPSCNECCNGDRCDDPTHYNRESCPFCLGTGRNATPAHVAKGEA